jgi:hypothetical protein
MSAANRDADLLVAVDEVDGLSRPRRPQLTGARIVSCCRRAVARALAVRDHEQRLAKLLEVVRGMQPADPTTTSIDGWYRLGAVQGAIDRWTGTTIPRLDPPDAPSEDHAAAYVGAYGLAWRVTHTAIEEVCRG